MTLWRSDDFHPLPVIRKFSATIQTRDIGPGQLGGFGTARLRAPKSDWKTVTSVPATEEHIHQLSEHDPPSTLELGCSNSNPGLNYTPTPEEYSDAGK